MSKSWKPEVQTFGDPKYYDNALRFATKEEAETYARNLSRRWMLVENWRAVESDDPVNFITEDGVLSAVEMAKVEL